MGQLENFWESVKKEGTALLATSASGNVTMRTVSPAYYEDAILIFTSPDSLKYQQLKENPNCCIEVGGCIMEAKARFLGRTMLDENASYRDVYSAKYTGAFDESENIAFGGRDADFILLKPVKVKGWGFENGEPTGPFEHSFIRNAFSDRDEKRLLDGENMITEYCCTNIFSEQAKELIEFYRQVLEIPFIKTDVDDSNGVYLGFIKNAPTICIWDCKVFDAQPTGYQSFVFQTENLDATIEWLKKKGLTLAEPVRYDWGNYELRLNDLDGNEIVIVEFV